MIGLLALTAIPTVTGVSEAVAQRDKKHAPKSAAHEERQMKRFHMRAYCAGRSPGKREVHGGMVVAEGGRLYIRSPTPDSSSSTPLFEGFFIEYPDPDRIPAELGLVAQVSFSPPLLNWIYMDGKEGADGPGHLCHGNRSESRPFTVGSWGTTDDFEEEDAEEGPGGLELEGEEKFVAVQPKSGGAQDRWELWWDGRDNKLAGVAEVEGRLVLRVTLDREYKAEEE